METAGSRPWGCCAVGVQAHPGPLAEPVLRSAGTDISHWFDEETGNPRSHVHCISNLTRPYCPQGRFIHLPPADPAVDWDNSFRTPWWRDSQYRAARRLACSPNSLTRTAHRAYLDYGEVLLETRQASHSSAYRISPRAAGNALNEAARDPYKPGQGLVVGAQVGSLAKETRVVRLKNVLTGQEDQMEVPCEEIIAEIRERYLDLNWHAKSYTWKALLKRADGQWDFKEMDLNLTLEDNGVLNETNEIEDLCLPSTYYVPALHLCWNDDLTVM